MSVSLHKGQGVSLRKNEYDLSSVTIGLGWISTKRKKVFWAACLARKRKSMTLMSSHSCVTPKGK